MFRFPLRDQSSEALHPAAIPQLANSRGKIRVPQWQGPRVPRLGDRALGAHVRMKSPSLDVRGYADRLRNGLVGKLLPHRVVNVTAGQQCIQRFIWHVSKNRQMRRRR